MSGKAEPQNIVIIRTDRIGEVLLSTVAVDVVKRCYPGSRVSFVTSEYSKPLLEDRGDIERIITVDTFSRGRTLYRAFKLAVLLRRGRFDIAIVFNPHRVLHLACFLAGIPVRAGYDRKWGKLLNKGIPDERGKGERHEIEYTMDLLRTLGMGGVVPAPRLPVNRDAEIAVERLLAEKNIVSESPLVSIHPGSSNPAKVWPYEKYVALIRRLGAELNCRMAVLGSGEETDLAGRIIREADTDVLNLAGRLDLKELAAFLKKSVLFIGNDTGPMHMAAALNVPVIAIFGRNMPGVSPVRWGPWGQGHVVFHDDPGCAPCYDAACPYDYRCLRAITADAVFNAAKRIIVEIESESQRARESR